jgi:hypothetical protein
MIAISTWSFGSAVVGSSSHPTQPSIASAAWALRSKRSDLPVRSGDGGRESQVRISDEVSSDCAKRCVAAIVIVEDAILIVRTVRTARSSCQGLRQPRSIPVDSGRSCAPPVLAR